MSLWVLFLKRTRLQHHMLCLMKQKNGICHLKEGVKRCLLQDTFLLYEAFSVWDTPTVPWSALCFLPHSSVYSQSGYSFTVPAQAVTGSGCWLFSALRTAWQRDPSSPQEVLWRYWHVPSHESMGMQMLGDGYRNHRIICIIWWSDPVTSIADFEVSGLIFLFRTELATLGGALWGLLWISKL